MSLCYKVYQNEKGFFPRNFIELVSRRELRKLGTAWRINRVDVYELKLDVAESLSQG